MKKGLLLFLALSLPQVALAKDKTPTVEQFAQMPLAQNLELSPDGKWIAGVSYEKGVPVVFVSPLAKPQFNYVVKLKKTRDRIEDVEWIDNDRLFVSASYPEYYYGQQYRVSHNYAVHRDGSNLQPLAIKIMGQDDYSWMKSVSEGQMLHRLPAEPGHIVLTAFDVRDMGYSVFDMNVDNGDFTKLASSHKDVNDWAVNAEGQVTFGFAYDKDKISVYKVGKDSKLTLVKELDTKGDITFDPITMLDDHRLAVISDYGQDREVMQVYDLAKQAFGEVLYQVPGYDIRSGIIRGNKLVGYSYIDDSLEMVYQDPDLQKMARMVHATFGKGGKAYLYDVSLNHKVALVSQAAPNHPTRYFVVDFKANKAAFWLSAKPVLEGKALANTQPVSFKTRDGLALHGYLTLPVNAQKPPVVVLPHGGPHARDELGFDDLALMLANQGYAVLKINYRGSTGYGDKFEIRGYEQWGLKMQDDLIDGLHWLQKTGQVDAHKACIVGGSYGGYAAMVASYRDSKDFQCAVAIAGISDLQQMWEKDHNRSSFLGALMAVTLGDPEQKGVKARWQRTSALEQVRRINMPMLLIHGDKDTRVNVEQSRELYQAAKAAGKDVHYVELKDGTHFIDDADSKVAVYENVAKFLKAHLG
ncbi:S9 family peptidase [Gallaecimonas mangrovi]|uniref:S9 family peptidase n=1 Tax=Gallaecimonas mangrovi TaxID=2291597 RepID=UPI001868DBF5|nr:prolyl oligopeptidase family serine peptidase [Gallaecimonas mangrovi]